MLGASWDSVGPSWAYVGPPWGYVGPSWGHLWPSWQWGRGCVLDLILISILVCCSFLCRRMNTTQCLKTGLFIILCKNQWEITKMWFPCCSNLFPFSDNLDQLGTSLKIEYIESEYSGYSEYSLVNIVEAITIYSLYSSYPLYSLYSL